MQSAFGAGIFDVIDQAFFCVSASEFRHIAFGQGPRNCERVFRAAVSAYCTLDQPTRREVAQLDDLTLGLYNAVSSDAHRFAAAALCECDPAPAGLVRRLCNEPVEIAAPLLVRSRVLSDVDLISLISRHGLAHARAIARREGLNPAIAALIRALLASAEQSVSSLDQNEKEANNDALDAVRAQLRRLMQRTVPDRAADEARALQTAGQNPFTALRGAAVSGDGKRFADILAQRLGLPSDRVRKLTDGDNYSDLLIAFKALGLAPEQAFLLTVAALPAVQLTHLGAIRLFLERYEVLDDDAVRLRVSSWRQNDEPAPALAGPIQSASAR